MRAMLNADDRLFEQLLKVTSATTKTPAVREALKGFIRLKRKERPLDHREGLDIEDNWRTLRAAEIARRAMRRG